MEIEKKFFGDSEFWIKPMGRIDLDTTSALENEVNEQIDKITYLTVDFSEVNYISSIGLRALLAFQKKMMDKGEMKITNVKPEVLEIFKMVGFDKILNII